MAAFYLYGNEGGYDHFEKFVMAGVHHDSEEYSRKTQIEEEPTDLESIANTFQKESNAATKELSDQAVRNAITNARICGENQEFEGIAGLCFGHAISSGNGVEYLTNSDRDNDDVVLVGDDAVGLDGSSGLSCDREHGKYAQRNRASSQGAQLTAHGEKGGDVGSRLAKRALLEQSSAASAAKNSDGNHWFGKGEKKTKA